MKILYCKFYLMVNRSPVKGTSYIPSNVLPSRILNAKPQTVTFAWHSAMAASVECSGPAYRNVEDEGQWYLDAHSATRGRKAPNLFPSLIDGAGTDIPV